MAAIDRVKADYASRLGERRPSLAVPEWGDDRTGDGVVERVPLVVYWKPYTLGDDDRCWSLADGTRGQLAKSYADVVFHKAEDAAGGRLFTEMNDLHVLKFEADQSVVKRIAQAIMASPSVADHIERLRNDALRLQMFTVAERLGKTIAELEALSVSQYREIVAAMVIAKENAA